MTYALGIYHLNLFIAFLSPKVDPSLMEDSGSVLAAHLLPCSSGQLMPWELHSAVFSGNIWDLEPGV